MAPPPSKRQKREEYRKAQQEAQQNANGEVEMPKKRYYRQRAHANPFSDHQLEYPLSPAHMDWASHFPAFVDSDPAKTNLGGTRKLVKDVEVVDIGCGFGGLLVGLAPLMPDTLMIGMEIRTQVLDYLRTRIHALRAQQQKARGVSISSASASGTPAAPSEGSPSSSSNQVDSAPMPEDAPSIPDRNASVSPSTAVPGGYQNISALRANTMKFLPNFFARHQLSKIFICFPDPHFKARKHKARIISSSLNAEYAYVLRPGGLLYTITDVEEYHQWILRHFGEKTTTTTTPEEGAKEEKTEREKTEAEAEEEEEENEAGVLGVRELWERVPNEELEKDECVRVMKEETEEGKKVTRNNGPKFVAVFRRRPDPAWTGS